MLKNDNKIFIFQIHAVLLNFLGLFIKKRTRINKNKKE